jgi:hypothetical protein
MDYLKEFEQNCKESIDQFEVVGSNAPTKNQRIGDFKEDLKRIKENINNILINHAKNYLEIAKNNGFREINQLEKNMGFLITDSLRKFEDDQKEKSCYEY